MTVGAVRGDCIRSYTRKKQRGDQKVPERSEGCVTTRTEPRRSSLHIRFNTLTMVLHEPAPPSPHICMATGFACPCLRAALYTIVDEGPRHRPLHHHQQRIPVPPSAPSPMKDPGAALAAPLHAEAHPCRVGASLARSSTQLLHPHYVEA